VARGRWAGVWTLVACGACASDAFLGPPDGLTHALGTASCGPRSYTVSICLAAIPIAAPQPTEPYLRLSVLQPIERLGPGSWVVAGSESAVSAQYFFAADSAEFAGAGRLTITAVDPDTTIHGAVDLRFPTAGRMTGTFQAVWLPRVPPCR